jgi:hypothetical protein
METLGGFPSLPAMLRCHEGEGRRPEGVEEGPRRSRELAGSARVLMETLGGFPSLPAMLRCHEGEGRRPEGVEEGPRRSRELAGSARVYLARDAGSPRAQSQLWPSVVK